VSWILLYGATRETVMVNIFWRLTRVGAVLFSSLVAGLASGVAHAACQPPLPWSAASTYSVGDVAEVNGTFFQSLISGNIGHPPALSPSQWNGNNILVCKLTVQPIDVCDSTGASCPFVNSLGQTARNALGTNRIGFIDPLTGLNAEQAAFAQIGVSLAFAPLVMYKSPTNPVSGGPDYRSLHTCSCNSAMGNACPSISSCSTGASSVDLLTLTQQAPPGLTSPPGPMPIWQGGTPLPPLNADQTIPNLFFVKSIAPISAGTIIRGFSWDGNNGGAIASDSVFSSPFGVGTIAHEIGHMAGAWEHNTLGAGPLMCPNKYPDPNSECTENLMTAGSSPRQLPNGFIDRTTFNCGAQLGQACWVPQVPPANTTPPKALDLLTTGGAGQCTIPSQCLSQQATILLSNFVYPIPNTVSGASGGAASAAQASVQSTAKTGAASSSSTSGSPVIFNVSGVSGGSPGETLLAYVVMIPQPSSGPQFSFSGSNPFALIKQSRRNLLEDFDRQPLDGDVPYPSCNPPFPPDTPSLLCGEVEFNRSKGQGFGEHDFIKFSLNILKGSAPATLADLCGAKVAFIYSDGYAPVSALGSGSCSGSSLTATSLSQDPTTPPQVVTVSTAPGPGTTPGCTPNDQGVCSNPVVTGVTDSHPSTGIEGSPICFDVNGFPIPCQ
jgi:hypothetical protein